MISQLEEMKRPQVYFELDIILYILGRAVTLNGSYKDFPGPCENSCTRVDVEGGSWISSIIFHIDWKVHITILKVFLNIQNIHIIRLHNFGLGYMEVGCFLPKSDPFFNSQILRSYEKENKNV